MWLPEDDLEIEACWSDITFFNVNNFMYVPWLVC